MRNSIIDRVSMYVGAIHETLGGRRFMPFVVVADVVDIFVSDLECFFFFAAFFSPVESPETCTTIAIFSRNLSKHRD